MSLFKTNFKVVLAILVIGTSLLSASANNTTNVSTVVITVDAGNTKEVVRKLLSDNQITLEFECRISGVIVVKVKHGFSEVGDVKGLVKNKISSVSAHSKIIFCDVHRGVVEGKC